MAENSLIGWTDHTFNAWEGCTKVSPGCANCYAEERAKRYGSAEWGPNGTRRVKAESGWKEPLKWQREAVACNVRPRVFCASLADVFEDWQGLMVDTAGRTVYVCNECGAWRAIEDICCGPNAHFPLTMNDVRARLFRLIDATPNLDWLLLTKRPENFARFLPPSSSSLVEFADDGPVGVRRNVWLGVTVENQEQADRRIPLLLSTPAKLRFLSVEPMLGPVDLRPKAPDAYSLLGRFYGKHGFDPAGMQPAADRVLNCFPQIDWVIIGGESGANARPMHPVWARALRDQCKAAGVPFYFKQWGEWCPSDIAPEPDPVPTTILKGSPAECVVMKRPPVSFKVVKPDGGDRLFNVSGRFSGESPTTGDCWMHKVGKKAAGRLLDGILWDEFPTA